MCVRVGGIADAAGAAVADGRTHPCILANHHGCFAGIFARQVSTKKELPAGFDKVLSNYVEPFLTPGIVGIFLLSGLLGLLQFYKFEGGKSGQPEDQSRSPFDMVHIKFIPVAAGCFFKKQTEAASLRPGAPAPFIWS